VTSAATGNQAITILRVGATPASRLTRLGSLNFGFPANWEHQSYALAVRPTPGEPSKYDLFFNIGSQFNDDPTTATVMLSGLISGTLQGESIYKVTIQPTAGTPVVSGLTQVAKGLRNASGIAVQPGTGDLYFEDNGIDNPANRAEPLSADELNRITRANIGGTVEDFGFIRDYIEYRTGRRVGSGAIQPLVAFQPIPNPMTGSESEGANEIAFAPAGFPTGVSNGVFIGFHGQFNLGGIANEENPLVYYDLNIRRYFDFIKNDEPNIGHLDGLLATADALFVADLTSTGNVFGAPAGVIYRIARA
jgi:glucose/arabinose dehydrogenase